MKNKEDIKKEIRLLCLKAGMSFDRFKSYLILEKAIKIAKENDLDESEINAIILSQSVYS